MFVALDGLKHGISSLSPEPKPFAVLGNADHGAMMVQDQLIEKFPEAKWIIIDRPVKEVEDAIRALGVKPDIHAQVVKLAELREKVQPLVIPFNQLDDSLTALTKLVHPTWSNPPARTSMLLEMNVQMDVDLGKSQLHTTEFDVKAEPPVLSQAHQAYQGLLWDMCQPNQSAFVFLVQVIGAALTWDHLIDDDAVDKGLLDQVFKSMFTEWPINPFVVQFGQSLVPTISSCISDWQYSYMDGASKDCAYSIYTDLPAAVAFILGGQQKVDQFMPRIRRLVAKLREEDDVKDGFKK